jgi:hypothetical protein
MRTTSQASKFALAILALWFGLGAETRTKADIDISTPSGLNPGDKFRIVFVTDGTTLATSTSISTYNTFVANDAKTQAGGGQVLYDGTPLSFSVIGSTSTTSAITNIGETGDRVYLANGTEVATSDDSNGWWKNAPTRLTHEIDQDLLGTTTTQLHINTGTTGSGTTFVSFALGDTQFVQQGFTTHTDIGWIDANTGETQIAATPMFGISQELTVPLAASVPEPSTLWIAGVGMLAGIAYGRSRKRRQEQRRQVPMGQTVAAD